MLDICLVGTGGMMPLPNRFLTALICRFNGRLILIDCGEGTQVSLKMLGWGFKNIDIICITHFHADHISGLPGMLLTIGNSGRDKPIIIIGPKGLKDVYNGLSVIAPELPFEVKCIEIDNENTFLFESDTFYINALKAEHVIDCYAYSINIPRKGKFDVQKAINLNIPKNLWSILQKGEDVNYNGKLYKQDMVLGNERQGIKVSYCTDSRPTDEISDFVRNSDLFICEGMYGDNEKLEKITYKKHMLFAEAAEIAKKANVKELWLTHFSPALTNPSEFEYVAKNIFENSIVGTDRMCKTILYQND